MRVARGACHIAADKSAARRWALNFYWAPATAQKVPPCGLGFRKQELKKTGGLTSTREQITPLIYLHQPLVQHRIGDLEEAADVGPIHQVAGRAVHLGRLVARLVDGDHDLVQAIVHFLAGPGDAHAVLRHLEA